MPAFTAALQDCSVGGWSSEAVLGCAARCLSWFVQLNWTGPPSAGLLVESFMGEAKWQKLNSDVLEEFVIDGIVRNYALKFLLRYLLCTFLFKCFAYVVTIPTVCWCPLPPYG